ncbi:Lactonase, 7-bladed beta-propeller-domain-containing protein [Podospora appendiculata]|uniref:Lactonase, 7-bladed beta-propeller-domain-containing protein n=1 Tax=Podospora appendiculata TaxID=314037 RepID=A0AAE0XLV1_9PEZI|nr:Lactonase, 7-bladed beta-propeller-domain-containing protein [Podospora appendiculata]
MVISSYRFFLLSLAIANVSAVKHALFVGNLNAPASIYALEFDDETFDFQMTNNITADASHSWITFNHDKTNIYGTSNIAPRIASYAITSNKTLKLVKLISADKTCANHTSAFVVTSPQAPYHVITGAWPGPNACGMSFNVTQSGTLDRVVDSWAYANKSGVHGLALGRSNDDSNSDTLYSADLNGDAIWTHQISREDGHAQYVGKIGVKAGSHPRHLAAHPNGQRLYAVMEAGNRVAAFPIDQTTATVEDEESTFSLIPDSEFDVDSTISNYWSAEVMLSANARFLWATARAQVNTRIPGYISAFLLDEQGAIVKRMFRVPTTTVAGIANAVSPAPWGSEWAALTDVFTGYVQIWKMADKTEGSYGTEYATADAVARVDIPDGGCCANAIWYN